MKFIATKDPEAIKVLKQFTKELFEGPDGIHYFEYDEKTVNFSQLDINAKIVNTVMM